ncbi:MAG: TetR family transcriptional regulator [Proteobacteria bacterium]|nr:TetR family transcriptional regulator [Pseudomonadota bacterium]
MKRTKEEAEETRRTIFKAALKVFSQRGYSGTRLEDVAAEAEVTRGAIYWHFKNKSHLYSSLLCEGYFGYGQRIQRILETDKSPLSKIRGLLKETLVSLGEDEEYRAVQELLFFKTEMLQNQDHAIKEIVKHNQKLKRDISHLVEKGIEIGEIDPETDSDLASLALISYLNGIEFTWMSTPRSFSVTDKADDLIEFMLQTIVQEATSRPPLSPFPTKAEIAHS